MSVNDQTTDLTLLTLYMLLVTWLSSSKRYTRPRKKSVALDGAESILTLA